MCAVFGFSECPVCRKMDPRLSTFNKHLEMSNFFSTRSETKSGVASIVETQRVCAFLSPLMLLYEGSNKMDLSLSTFNKR